LAFASVEITFWEPHGDALIAGASDREPGKWSVDMSRQYRKLCLFLIFVSVSTLACAATLGFQPVLTYSVGTAPAAVSAGDFNADGSLDMGVLKAGGRKCERTAWKGRWDVRSRYEVQRLQQLYSHYNRGLQCGQQGGFGPSPAWGPHCRRRR